MKLMVSQDRALATAGSRPALPQHLWVSEGLHLLGNNISWRQKDKDTTQQHPWAHFTIIIISIHNTPGLDFIPKLFWALPIAIEIDFEVPHGTWERGALGAHDRWVEHIQDQMTLPP